MHISCWERSSRWEITDPVHTGLLPFLLLLAVLCLFNAFHCPSLQGQLALLRNLFTTALYDDHLSQVSAYLFIEQFNWVFTVQIDSEALKIDAPCIK